MSLGEVWKGVEPCALRAHRHNVEKLFHVQPGADPKVIRMQVEGAKTLQVASDGSLELDTAAGPVRFTAPVAYQDTKQGTHPWRWPMSPMQMLRLYCG